MEKKKTLGLNYFLPLIFAILLLFGCSNKCGDGHCEISKNYKEDFSVCPADCPDCDDNDLCTEDFFDYENQVCKYILIEPCCGNQKCEIGEDLKCPQDCPEGLSGFSIIVPEKYSVDEKGDLSISLKNTGENPVEVYAFFADPGRSYSLDYITIMPQKSSSEFKMPHITNGKIDEDYYIRLRFLYTDLITSQEKETIGTIIGKIGEKK